MANLEDYIIQWKHVPRPWGNEIRFNAINKVTGHIWQEVVHAGSEIPDENKINELMSVHLGRCEQGLLDMVIEEAAKRVEELEAPKKQAEAYLKAEGILKESETLATLKTSIAELAALKAEPIEAEVKP
jgi:hypothetical protein